jgi:uncharacterized protein YkwD
MTSDRSCRILSAVSRGTLIWIAAAGALLLGVASPATAAPTAATRAATSQTAAADSFETSVLAKVNAFRARHGLAPLRLNLGLVAAADAHTTSMARRGFFSHRSPDGSAAWRRVRRFYRQAGYDRWSVGENLLWSSWRVDGARALRLWLRSRPHRRNLLTPRWREIGLSAVQVVGAPGFYDGRDVTILTANFGVRR